ncbi:MAG TPA: hypothetical protein VIY52_17340 [Streptosporangiaceae bacterium]
MTASEGTTIKPVTGGDGKGNGGDGKGNKGASPFGPVGVRGNPKQTYSPWLVVRYAPGDIGDRPLAPGAVFWESPDVWVVSSLGINQPVPGEANQVYARVTNYGLQQANGVVVKFWWVNPSLAISEADANLIGIAFANIASLRSDVVPCPDPWIPIEENGGHECLLAEAYVPGLDPLTTPMDPVADRHVGQKIEQLVTVRAGQMFRVGLTVANPSPLAQAATVEVYPVVADALPGLVAGRFAESRELRPPTRVGLSVALDEPQQERLFLPPSRLFARRLLDAELPGETGDGFCQAPQVTHAVDLAAWESMTVEFRGLVPATAGGGDTFMLRVLERLGSVVTGGYTVAVVVT